MGSIRGYFDLFVGAISGNYTLGVLINIIMSHCKGRVGEAATKQYTKNALAKSKRNGLSGGRGERGTRYPGSASPFWVPRSMAYKPLNFSDGWHV